MGGHQVTRPSMREMLSDFQKRGGTVSDAAGRTVNLALRDKAARIAAPAQSPIERRHTDCATLRIIGRMVDMNRYARNRGHRIRGVDASKQLVREAWVRAGRPVIKGTYKLALHMVLSTRKLDPSNMYQGAIKAFLDGAQDVGLVESDRWQHHVGPDGVSWEFNRKADAYVFTVASVAGEF